MRLIKYSALFAALVVAINGQKTFKVPLERGKSVVNSQSRLGIPVPNVEDLLDFSNLD